MDRLLEMSVSLVEAHLSASSMDSAKIPALIREIHRTLKDLSNEDVQSAPEESASSPVISPTPRAGHHPPVINEDTSDPDFQDLDNWLAARVSERIARRLNRGSSIHPSVFPDRLICLEDGKELKLLRPYIRNRFGLSMSEYIDRWKLPEDYPIAPAAFVAAKRDKAKASGLGVTTRGPRGSNKRQLPGSKARSRIPQSL